MTHLMKSAAETFGVSIDCCMTPKSRAPTATTHSHSHRPGAAVDGGLNPRKSGDLAN
jgi:hypothetical protein